MQERRDRLVELLPENNWDIVKAGIAAGYAPGYAKTKLPIIVRGNRALCQRILDARNSHAIATMDLRQEAVKTLRDIIADPETSQRDRISAVSELGRINGWHSETRVLETGPRAEQLRQAEIAVARRAALATYDTHLLEDGSYAPAAPPMQHGSIVVVDTEDTEDTGNQGDTDTEDTDADAIPDEQDT